MKSLTQPIRLNVQFEAVSTEDAAEIVEGATALPAFGASCGPGDTPRLSCECGGDPCADPTIISPQDEI